ncbi:16S rRNA (cytidine(1402)-2'-O)-methyltransferase [Patescibacteria group bacterium]|nr:16S rRNA (cytidine(1402)-2'-O)-methyltransferase [Patescibacteria group bacterium]MBU1501136.1 16S rRNA (cytidine(1402)-2'-O)-methyltransferase [Patescibacteria group bacterium]MBU2080991.1 16S rRNA (cytidine(1402)-2'-O)-methyltransferase [Patescibacteria group bacterium]MBU2124083.1 16S rRNA (cytidine(1402)-2'-O)-methyltransferase [Patescibacteria group bacterium]MBU2194938.1 16S rRNA (cytidine(1402)-2'-O)-methyltransferase [Patescibacteria group bacterium]
MGTLSVVATPIGNLADITLRALETLKQADVIACEDTRVTAKLLARYEIQKPLVIFHAQSGTHATTRILSLLGEGKHVALVTDAGTPGISDPGSMLVRQVRDRLGDDVRIETLPGPAAVTAALSIAGVPTDEFVFLGFLPHKKGRQTLFAEIAESKRTMVFYESPHRIEKALASLAESLPEKRKVLVFRELTKMYESVIEGSAEEVAAHFAAHQDQVRGEFVVIVSS